MEKIEGYITICTGATGRLIDVQSLLAALKVKKDLEKLPHIFLYLVTVKIKHGNLKIAQIFSADQHYLETQYFLEKFLNDFKKPNEVHTDQAPAIMKGIVCAFTSCRSTKEYVDKYFEVLVGKSESSLPEVYIRNDVAHYVKGFYRKEAFKGMLPQVKHFYLCVMGYLLQCDSFEIIKLSLLLLSENSSSKSTFERVKNTFGSEQKFEPDREPRSV